MGTVRGIFYHQTRHASLGINVQHTDNARVLQMSNRARFLAKMSFECSSVLSGKQGWEKGARLIPTFGAEQRPAPTKRVTRRPVLASRAFSSPLLPNCM